MCERNLGNTNRVTKGNCVRAGQKVECVRAVFGGGLIDGASRDSIESGAFCFAQQSDLPESRGTHAGIVDVSTGTRSAWILLANSAKAGQASENEAFRAIGLE